jgi:3-deoxy-manno-octulosonate cytidylyltransferase (CMP-KDO synthetase)
MKVVGLIPSRYASTRLPAEALLPIDGLPVVVHVYKRSKLAKTLDEVCVCTDSERTGEVVQQYGGKVAYTSSEHPTGTDRIAEVARSLDADFIVDIQGDEPLISPYNIDAVVEFHRQHPEFDIILPTLSLDNPISPHLVKVVTDSRNRVLFISRNVIPYPFKRSPSKYLKHLSVISFKPDALQRFGASPQTELELVEGVELLRALELGMSIGTVELEGDSFSIDIEEDHEKAKIHILNDELRGRY